MTKEIWEDVAGYEGYYQVSNLGIVRSMDRIVPHSRWGAQFVRGRVLKPDLLRDGYTQVTLSMNNTTKRRKVHHLVLESFVSERPDGLVTNHKNGVKSDNRLCNLEYATISENVRHSLDVLGNSRGGGNPNPGERNGSSKLVEADVLEIRRLRSDNALTYKEIAAMFDIGISQVARITNLQSWTHL